MIRSLLVKSLSKIIYPSPEFLISRSFLSLISSCRCFPFLKSSRFPRLESSLRIHWGVWLYPNLDLSFYIHLWSVNISFKELLVWSTWEAPHSIGISYITPNSHTVDFFPVRPFTVVGCFQKRGQPVQFKIPLKHYVDAKLPCGRLYVVWDVLVV